MSNLFGLLLGHVIREGRIINSFEFVIECRWWDGLALNGFLHQGEYIMKMIFHITLQAIMHNVNSYLVGGIPIFQTVELRVMHSVLWVYFLLLFQGRCYSPFFCLLAQLHAITRKPIFMVCTAKSGLPPTLTDQAMTIMIVLAEACGVSGCLQVHHSCC